MGGEEEREAISAWAWVCLLGPAPKDTLDKAVLESRRIREGRVRWRSIGSITNFSLRGPLGTNATMITKGRFYTVDREGGSWKVDFSHGPT